MKRIGQTKPFTKRLLLITGCISISLSGLCQTGAAGVGTSANNVIWLDASSLNLTNGTPVSSFTDLSGNSNNFTQSTSTKRPTFKTNMVNGLPALAYDGTNDVLNSGSISALESANLTYFIVFRRSPLQLQYLIGANYTSSDKKWINYTNSANNLLMSAHYSPTIKYTNFNEPGGTFTFTSTHIIPTSISQRSQGTLVGSTLGAYTVPTGHNKVTLGNVPYTTWQNCTLNGHIAEVVIYNTAVNNLERVLIENYLGAKYNMAIPTDLFAYQATHFMGLIGIGNNGTNSQTNARGAGIVQIYSPASMTSNEYLLTAHTNDDLSLFTTADIPVSQSGSQRFTRTWKVDETGDVGNLTVDFILAGANNFATSSSYRLLVDNVTQDENFTDATVVVGSYNASTQTMSFNVDLNDGDIFTLCGVEQILTIHSIATGNWSDPNTWDCTCIPGPNDLVYIDPFNTVTVDINATTHDFSVEPSGTLTMSSAVTLSIGGNWDIAGVLNFTAGEVEMVGDADQYVDAGGASVTFNDIEINNSTSSNVVFYLSEYILNGTLYPTKGNLIVDPTPGTSFIINSTSDVGGGRIATINGGATINGNITVRRFIPGGVADYRDIASPVIGATLTQWDDDMYISGVGFPDGCAIGTGGVCYYSVKKYVINAYVDQTSMSNPLTNGVGFEAYMGDDTIVLSAATLDVTGPVRDASDYAVTVGNQWQIQGNPYASPVSFPLITRSHVDNYFYIYCPTTGNYEYWDGSDNSSSIPEMAGGIIAVGQGFWTYNWGTLTYKEADKVSSATFVKSMEDVAPLQILLRENISTYYSSISLVEHYLAEDDIDTIADIRHLSTGAEKAPTVAFNSTDGLIRKNYIKDDKRNKSFDLFTKILNPGYYTLEAINIENFSNYRRVLLFDNVTNQFIDLKKELAYVFYSDIFEGNRFTLILTNEELDEHATTESLTINETQLVENGMTITQMGHNFNIELAQDLNENSQIKLVNVLGQTEAYSTSVKFVVGSNMITVPADLKGVHVLVITTGNNIVTKKVVL